MNSLSTPNYFDFLNRLQQSFYFFSKIRKKIEEPQSLDADLKENVFDENTQDDTSPKLDEKNSSEEALPDENSESLFTEQNAPSKRIK
ncbi:MAG: hypothetical protein E6Q95_05575 [Chitinophagaceae bacterium]|nr:MAG: hypothetical protein E6Q95_05575 [Chitinophagaceae bacterium]